jgi:hypothetical protein
MGPPGENSENATNEAKFDDNVIIIQDKESVGVAANSGVDWGLDKREEQPGRAEGNEELIRDNLAMLPDTHRIQDDRLAALRTQAAAFDDSVEGERLRRYATSCDRSLHRTFADFLKNRKDGTTPEFDIIEPVDSASSPVIAANDRGPQDRHAGNDAQLNLQTDPPPSFEID